MKKFIFGAAIALVMCACGTQTEQTVDTTVEDTVVDTVVVDTTATDTTMTLEGTYSGLK